MSSALLYLAQIAAVAFNFPTYAQGPAVAVPAQNDLMIKPSVSLTVYVQKWCGFCKAYERDTLKKMIANKHLNNIPIDIHLVDCGENELHCDTIGIKSYPTSVLYENGMELNRFTGKRECSQVTEWMNQHLCVKNNILTSIINCKVGPLNFDIR